MWPARQVLGELLAWEQLLQTLRPLSLGAQQRTQPFNKVCCSRDLGRNLGLSFKSLCLYAIAGKVVKLASASVYRDSSLAHRWTLYGALSIADEYSGSFDLAGPSALLGNFGCYTTARKPPMNGLKICRANGEQARQPWLRPSLKVVELRVQLDPGINGVIPGKCDVWVKPSVRSS